MNEQDLRVLVRGVVLDVAPDLTPEDVRDDADLRADLDMDSMDYLDVVSRLAEQTGVEIADRDYDRLTSVAALAGYLAAGGAARASR